MNLKVTQKLFMTLALWMLATSAAWADGFSWSSEYRTANGLTFHRNFTNDDPAGKTLTLIRASKNNVEHYGSTNQYGQTQGSWTSPGEGLSGEKLVGPEEYTKDSYVIPAEVDGMPVVAMTNDVFENNKYIKSITFATANLTVVVHGSFASSSIETLNFAGSSIKEIGLGAFANCASLKSIDDWGSVETIHGGSFGPGAFGNCTALTEIRIGPSVKNIYGNAFGGNPNVTKLIIDDGDEPLVLSAGGGNEGGIYGMFYDSPISYVYYGRKLAHNQHDGYAWFTNPLCLIKEEVRKTIAKMEVETGPKVDTLRNCLFKGMDVPLYIKAPDATYIGTYAFENANLKSIDVPKIKKIDSHAFYNCLLTTLNFYSVEEIGSYAFQGARMETISLPPSLKYVGVNSFDDEYVDYNDQTFADANGYYPTKSCIKTLRFEDGDDPIELGFNGDEESDQFRYGLEWLKSNTLEELYIGRPVGHEPVLNEYGNTGHFSSALKFRANDFPKLKKVELTKVTMLSNAAFSAGFSEIDSQSCLEEVSLPMLKAVPSQCFYNCTKLTKLNIPKAETLWDEAFAYTSGNLDISFINNVDSIKSSCFAYSGIGGELTIPGTVKFMGKNVFYNCENLKKVTFEYGEKPLGMEYFWASNYASSGKMSIGGYKCGIEEFYFDRNIEPGTYTDGYGDTYTYRFEIAISDGSYGSIGYPKLKSVTIGKKLTSLDGYSFPSTGLDFIRCENPSPIAMEYESYEGDESFNANHSQGPSFSTYVQQQVKLLVPDGSVSDYLAADVWKGFRNLTDDQGDLGTIAITIPKEGCITYSGLHNLDFSSLTDIKAYIVSSYDGDTETIELSPVTDVTADVGRETGVIIKGTPGTYQVPVVPTATKSSYLNMLASLPNTLITLQEKGYTYFNYSSSAVDVFHYYLENGGFLKSDGTAKVGPNAAYLNIPESLKSSKGDDVTVTLGKSAFTTLYPQVDLNFTNVQGLEAYCATGITNKGVAILTRVSKVPAYTTVLLKGTAEATYTIPSEKVKAVCMNMLQVNPYENAITIEESQNYADFYLDGDKFKKAKSGTTIAPGEVYLRGLIVDGPDEYDIVLKETETVSVSNSFVYESIPISSAKQLTYCSDKDLDFSSKPELKAYVATGYDKTTGTIWLTRVKDVPANTGFLLMGDAGDYNIPVKEDGSNSYYKNLFKGTLSGMTLQATDGGNTNYYLSNGDYGVGFYKVTKEGGVELKPNRAYLSVPTEIPAVGSAGSTETIKVSAAGQVPYYTTNSLDFTTMDAKGVKAYTATGYDYGTGTIWLSRVKKVPAETGILVMAPEGSYPVPTASVASVYDNMFKGSLSASTIQTTETIDDVVCTNYYLSNGDYGVGFYKVTKPEGISLGANRCYLPIPNRSAGTRGIDADAAKFSVQNSAEVIGIRIFSNGTTGIKEVKNGEVKGEEWFTLQGQRVNNPGKGIYIHNGKKVVIK